MKDLVVQLSNPRPFKPVDGQAYSIPISKLNSDSVKDAAEKIFSQLSKSIVLNNGKKGLNDIRFQVTTMKGGKPHKVHTFKAEMKQKKSKVVFKIHSMANPVRKSEVTMTIKRPKATKGGTTNQYPYVLPTDFLVQPYYYDYYQFDQAYIDYWNLNMWSMPYWSYSPIYDPLAYYSPYSPFALPIGNGGVGNGAITKTNPNIV
jgi:hypothetical protein